MLDKQIHLEFKSDVELVLGGNTSKRVYAKIVVSLNILCQVYQEATSNVDETGTSQMLPSEDLKLLFCYNNVQLGVQNLT